MRFLLILAILATATAANAGYIEGTHASNFDVVNFEIIYDDDTNEVRHAIANGVLSSDYINGCWSGQEAIGTVDPINRTFDLKVSVWSDYLQCNEVESTWLDLKTDWAYFNQKRGWPGQAASIRDRFIPADPDRSTVTWAAVPEPSSALLFILAVSALVIQRWHHA